MPYTPESLEHGRWLFAQECRFVSGGAELGAIPATEQPEIAFAGRSNVGKSSLVNALTGRKTLAKTSATPGRTRQLNFFLLAEKLMLVDLPGHGYAKAPKTEIASWTRLVKHYLSGRRQLVRVLLLIDARQGVMKPDEETMDLLDAAAVPFQFVITKQDKVKASELEALKTALQAVLKRHPAGFPEIIATSSEKSRGIEELRAELASLCSP